MRGAARAVALVVVETRRLLPPPAGLAWRKDLSELYALRVYMHGTAVDMRSAAQILWGCALPAGGVFGRGRRGFPAHPCVQIGSGLACQRRMKGRINIIRPGLGSAGHEPASVQGAEQGQGRGRFARITAH